MKNYKTITHFEIKKSNLLGGLLNYLTVGFI